MPYAHSFAFDPAYGYDEAKLMAVPAPAGPADFASFWQRTFQDSSEVPLNLARRRIESLHPDFATYEIEFDSLGGLRIGGWLTVPLKGPIEHGLVVGHGYGGRTEPAFEIGAVSLAPCARGFNRSATPKIAGEAMRHVLNGIENRETYSHRGCAADLWQAASALLELHPELAGRLDYLGVSFGGGIGALALPWDDRFRRAALIVPSFGNHPLRLQLPCIGSGEAVRRYHRRHPEVLKVLDYFDAATAACHLARPTLVAAALFDPAVPPPGQFAVFNGLAGPKELFVCPAGHFDYPTEPEVARRLQAAIDTWWRA